EFNQSGLLFVDGSPKPYAQGFVFPLVGTTDGGQIDVWGRTPGGQSGMVTIEHSDAGGWTTVATVMSDASGIFQTSFASDPTGSIRALALGQQSLDFPLGPDPHADDAYSAFGGPFLEPQSATTPPTKSGGGGGGGGGGTPGLTIAVSPKAQTISS